MRSLLASVCCELLLLCAVAATAPASSSVRDPLASGRMDETIASLRAQAQAAPTDAEAFHFLSRAYYQLEKWDDSILAAQRAVSLQPSSSDYHLWLGRAYGNKAEHSSWFTAIRLAKKTRIEFERAVELNSASVNARTDLAEYYMEAPGFLGGGTEKARVQAAQIAAHDAAAAHWVTGRLAEKANDFTQAEKEYRAAISTSRNPGGEWLNLASFYRRTKRFKEMEEAIGKAVSQEKKTNVLFDAADLLYRAGRNFPGAAQLVRSYISSKPHGDEAPAFQAHYLLGQILERQGDKQAAATEYRASLALASNYRQAQEALKRVER